MRPVVFRLVLCASLFAVWIGYLVYLVATRPRTPQDTPLVLSRPQILASAVDVLAPIDTAPKGETEITIVEVLYPTSDRALELKAGDKIKVTGLEDCRPAQRFGAPLPPPDWAGPGEYLVPLRPLRGGPEVQRER